MSTIQRIEQERSRDHGRLDATDVDPDDHALETPMDMILADAGQSPLRRMVPGMSGVRAVASLATKPRTVARRTAGLAAELVRVGVGRSEVAPARSDKRWGDEAWEKNPFFKRTMQGYLAWGEAMRELVDDADLDWADGQRMGFIVDNIVEALAPTNAPVLNPTVLKRTIDTGGGNFLNGGRRFLRDYATAPRVPSMVESDAFSVGEDLAMTPGKVVLRTELFELIEYAPQTDKVRTIPLLIVPPTINKYYIIDLAPERSMVEHLVRSGLQVYVMSWRNPDSRHADWNLDAYGAAILEAMDAANQITRTTSVSLLGICSGGIITSMLMGHLAATDQLDKVSAYSLMVTVLDQGRAGTTSALLSHKVAAAAVARSEEKGYLDGRTLAEIFAWLRPTDLIWRYWINNYLMGRPPKAFDILYWNADPVRMTAGMHHDFLDLALRNALVEPGKGHMLGSLVDLSQVTTENYVVAGIADHLCSWESCYQSTQMLGGPSTFVLSTSGHIAAMVNPPGNPKASFRTSEENPPTTQEWLEQASKKKGTWWDDYAGWVGDRSGEWRGKPVKAGSSEYPPVCDAPGTFVHDR
ncbi:hypothetical protein KLP28_09995 [Nocardioidaceae bacterium]|nr:hypothetical protein KLP28_09995 [Nocardioidaceae bacterium]